MSRTRVVKLFRNGASQAVRLPAEFRFEGKEVYATRDDATGGVVLSTRPRVKTWDEFFELMRSIDTPADFMADRPMNEPPVERDIFGMSRLQDLQPRFEQTHQEFDEGDSETLDLINGLLDHVGEKIESIIRHMDDTQSKINGIV